MPAYTIRKSLELEVTVEAMTAQEAFDLQLEMDDNMFVVNECDYVVLNEDGIELDVETH